MPQQRINQEQSNSAGIPITVHVIVFLDHLKLLEGLQKHVGCKAGCVTLIKQNIFSAFFHHAQTEISGSEVHNQKDMLSYLLIFIVQDALSV